jgi:hypothetical protein
VSEGDAIVEPWLIDYSQKFQIVLAGSGDAQSTDESAVGMSHDFDSLFDYRAGDLCKVGVRPVVHGPDVSGDARNLASPTDAQLLPVKWYSIHQGYLRVIEGFLREIDLKLKDKVNDHDCLYRAVYLLKILDHFAQELPSVTRGMESRWRSRALNPLLQRQLVGICDLDLETTRCWAKTPDAVARLYLTRDPLDPDEVTNLLRGILYVWPVFWSLGHLGVAASVDDYRAIRERGKGLRALRRCHDMESMGGLRQDERDLICDSKLQHIFNLLFNVAVSHPFLPSVRL